MACAPSITVRMPAARARRQISASGKISAVGLVMWLRKMTLVRGVTPDQNNSTNSACVVTGVGMCCRTKRAPVR